MHLGCFRELRPCAAQFRTGLPGGVRRRARPRSLLHAAAGGTFHHQPDWWRQPGGRIQALPLDMGPCPYDATEPATASLRPMPSRMRTRCLHAGVKTAAAKRSLGGHRRCHSNRPLRWILELTRLAAGGLRAVANGGQPSSQAAMCASRRLDELRLPHLGGRPIATCPEAISTVAAPMRLANWRSASGRIASSCSATRYQVGWDFQAGTPMTSPNADRASPCCTAYITFAVTGSTSPAK